MRTAVWPSSAIALARRTPSPTTLLVSVVLAISVALSSSAAETVKGEPGLAVEFESAGARDRCVVSLPALFVVAGASPTPFLAAGPFSSVWTGHINADLRSDFLFQVEVSGKFDLEINGTNVLSAEGTNFVSPFSKPVRLRKGLNPIKATFRSPAQGDALFRLQWAEKPFLPGPIPSGQLFHPPSEELAGSLDLRLARELVVELRCIRCHLAPDFAQGMPELQMDAPAFDGIGSRRSYDWMRRWIENPKAIRPLAHMPKLFHGVEAGEQARAAAAYLASLKTKEKVDPIEPIAWKSLTPPPAEGPTVETKPLFERLHCVACHLPPDTKEADPERISLSSVVEKFPEGRLEEFLRQPTAHYRWIRMPDFRLSSAEAKELASYLIGPGGKSAPLDPPSDAALLEKGRVIVQTAGCLNCHGSKLANRASAPAWKSLSPDAWKRGCLAEQEPSSGNIPWHSLSAKRVSALRAFASTDRSSLARHDPVEFASRQTRLLRCASCHGQFDGFPALELLGGKLKPEWAAAFMGGEISYKPRAEKHPKGEVWLEARMPAFPAYASLLAPALAQESGYAPHSSPETASEPELAKIGRTLLGKAGGFSCVSCHAVNTLPALEVFESEGINLARTVSRIRRDYFRRWMKLPLSVDPSTKMPAYFDDEGKSPLGEFLEGDASNQIDAIWEFLKQEESMKSPGVDE